MSEKHFDAWAKDYDACVAASDEENSYPFAGYTHVLRRIYQLVMAGGGGEILDLGFGTGMLTERLYRAGCSIWGMDFSNEMIALAREKMPQACLIQGDFAMGIPSDLQRNYDFVIATYALHHLDDHEKLILIRKLQSMLRPQGRLLIGDVAFASRAAMESCRQAVGEAWDEEEYYFAADEWMAALSGAVKFEEMSMCAGVFIFEKC